MKLKLLFFLLTALQCNAQCWKTVAPGYNSTAGIMTDGTLWIWGTNEYGVLGNPQLAATTVPVRVGTSSDWLDIQGAGGYVALKGDGTLWSWGSNYYGTMGQGHFNIVTIPTKIGNQNNWSKISVTNGHCLAIKTDGTLWSWGLNESGQLGKEGNSTNIPQQVGIDTNWQSISAGYWSSMAIKTDGTLWGWGYNTFGQLGNGTEIPFNFAVTQTGIDTDWTSISVGSAHSFAMKSDGTLWGAGKNNAGELGQIGDDSNIFIQLGADTDWIKVKSAYDATFAIKSDNSLWAWGNNENGVIGNGIIQERYLPFLLLENISQIDSHNYGHSMAINTTGSLIGFGQNESGQLGNGNTTNAYTPIVITTCTLGIQDAVENSALKIYPNPVQNQLTIFANRLEISSLTIIDATGKVVFKQLGNLDSIDTSKLSSGIYFLKINSINTSKVLKFIKQ